MYIDEHAYIYTHTNIHIHKYIHIYMHTTYIQNIYTKHDKTEHKWKHTWIYTYIKPLRSDPTKWSNIPNQILGYV